MVSKKLILCLSAVWLWGLEIRDWNDLPIAGIATDTVGDFTYNQNEAQRFVLDKQIFFINPNATLKINANVFGNWTNESCGIMFCATGAGNRIEFNKGNMVFSINSSELVAQRNYGYFTLTNGAELTINSNFSVNFDPRSVALDGVFRVDGSNLRIEDADLNIDAWGKVLFRGVGNSEIFVNFGGNYKNQKIRLYGDIGLSDNAKMELRLGNKSSYYEGNIRLVNNANFNLYLSDSSARILNYTQSTQSRGKIELQASVLDATLGTASQTELALYSNSIWKMQGSSQIGNLMLQSSSVDLVLGRFGQPVIPKVLTSNMLEGSGTFILYADVQSREIDTLNLAQASGNHKIKLFYNPHTFTQERATAITEADNMVIATIAGIDSQATFEGLSTDMGLTSYKTNLISRLQNGGKEWLISSIVPDGDSPLSRALSTALNTPYRLFDLTSSALALRLGDLRHYPKDHGLYARYIVGLGNLKEGKNTFQTQDVWMSFAGGYDMNKVYRSHTDFLGFGFEVSLMDSKNSAFTSSTQAYGANLYYTSIFHNRFYYDVIFKYAFSPNSFEFVNTNNLSGEASLNAHLITLGLELGGKVPFEKSRNFFYIEPQGKLTSGVILPTSFEVRDIYNERIYGELKTQIPLITRASLYFGYEWNEGFRGDFKLGSFVEYSLSNGGDIFLKDSRSHLNKSFDGDLDVGISAMGSIEMEKFLRVYMQLDSAFLGDYVSNVAFNVGVRWSFGDRYVPPPPPPADPNRVNVRYKYTDPRRRTIPVVKEDDITNMKYHGIGRERFERDYRRFQESSRPSMAPQAPTQGGGNENRFYPRDKYVPNSRLDTQKEYNRGNKRDAYIPQYREQNSGNRFYKRDGLE